MCGPTDTVQRHLKLRNVICLEVCELLGAFLGRRDAERLLLIVVEVARVASPLALRDKVGLNLKQCQLQ